jgi:hypothetical protein
MQLISVRAELTANIQPRSRPEHNEQEHNTSSAITTLTGLAALMNATTARYVERLPF